MPEKKTSTSQTDQTREKRTPSKRKREEEKENSMEIAKIKVLEALLSRLSDDKVTTSGGMSWRSGYEAGFQAGFQQGMALSQLPIQQVQPRPAFQSLYPLQRAAPFFLSTTYVHLSECTSWAADAWANNAKYKPRQYVTIIGHHSSFRN